MRSFPSLLKKGIMLFLISSSLNLSCSALPLAPPLNQRTLEINPEKPGLIYRWKECVHKIIWCVKYEDRVDEYDLTDPLIRQQLFDMGFVLKVREVP